MAAPIQIRAATGDDAEYILATLRRHWISPTVWSRDVPFHADRLPGLVAWVGGERVGLLTYSPGERECEVITLSSDRENIGVGAALLEAAVAQARRLGCVRIFLTTSNDNLRAIGFYQRRGWRIVAVYPGAIDRSRAREKAIPLIGASGIESHDELELELRL